MKFRIVLVPFPFDDFTETKVRPAVCLTEKIGKYEHIVIAFITSQTPSDISETDIAIKKGKLTGLKVDSFLRLHRLTTIPFDLVKRELGQVPHPQRNEIMEKLKFLFDLE